MVLLALLTLTSLAPADQLVEGDALRVYYDSDGYWNDGDADAGLQALHGGTWVEWTYPGNPYMVWALSYSSGGETTVDYADSYYYGTNMTVSDETDASTSVAKVATYTYAAGDVTVVKTESWRVADRVMRVDFAITNGGKETLSDLQLLFATDPDPDYVTTGNYSTLNAVLDLDGDGTDDWVESVSPADGYTLGFGACDQPHSALGHYSDWSYVYTPGETLTDEEGEEADDAMGLNWVGDTDLEAGAAINVRLLVVVADTTTDAEDGGLASGAYCEDCDADGDGYDRDICGGDDCAPDDGSVSPGEAETWYDGIDGDCSGGSDYDADADGHDSDAYGGDDCDDTSAIAYPGGTETWYDGIDGDCSGGSDYDADGDNHDADAYGGDDCDDTDAIVNPETTEIWYDGIDEDCSGGSDNDADGDGHDAEATGGDDCDDTDAGSAPGTPEIYYDGIDEDCAGDLDEYDADGDGENVDGYGGQDCDDSDPSTFPGADDPDGDGVDQNCDGDGGSDTAADDTASGELTAKPTGCGCACTPPSGLGLAWLGLAGLLIRRRRR